MEANLSTRVCLCGTTSVSPRQTSFLCVPHGSTLEANIDIYIYIIQNKKNLHSVRIRSHYGKIKRVLFRVKSLSDDFKKFSERKRRTCRRGENRLRSKKFTRILHREVKCKTRRKNKVLPLWDRFSLRFSFFVIIVFRFFRRFVQFKRTTEVVVSSVVVAL